MLYRFLYHEKKIKSISMAGILAIAMFFHLLSFASAAVIPIAPAASSAVEENSGAVIEQSTAVDDVVTSETTADLTPTDDITTAADVATSVVPQPEETAILNNSDQHSLVNGYVDPNAPQIHSRYGVLIDADTGSVLFEKNSNEHANPASTTKVMTCIVVLENVADLDAKVTLGEEAEGWSIDNSLMGLSKGEEVSVRDLLYGMMLVSGNDAALALARYVGNGQESSFVALMNAKASELGMKNTHYANMHGLTDEEHYTTAADMAVIARYAMQNDDFKKIVSTPEYELAQTNMHPARTILTTNRFLSPKEANTEYHWSICTGIKTGATAAAQGCLVSSASYNDMNLIAVTFYDDSPQHVERWNDAKSMLEYGFNNLDRLDLGDATFDPVLATVENASQNDEYNGLLTLAVDASDIFISGLSAQITPIRQSLSTLRVKPEINQGLPLKAPIHQGDIVGTATILLGDTPLAVVDLVASRNVESNENDSTHVVTSLFQDTGNTNSAQNTKSPAFYIAIVLAVTIVLLIIILLIRVFGKGRKQSNRGGKKRRYYNYRD